MVRHAFLVLALLTLACSEPPERVDGGARDLRPPVGDARLVESAPAPLIDFVVEGCATRTADRCQGPAPLALTFSAAVQVTPLSATWDFGDGTPAASGTPVAHTYARPGAYTVTLAVGTASGTVSEEKSDFVVAQAAAAGAACGVDKACASGKCVCQEGCPAPLAQGLCLEACDQVACTGGSICVDLSAAAGEQEPAPWRRLLCLPTCTVDADCHRPGFVCRLAPSGSSWARACLPPLLRALGDPCRGSEGAPDPSLCLGGLCLDLGVSGLCSASCASRGCPDGSRCARFSGQPASSVCLVRCAGSACTGDPRLACELPSSAGDLGFAIVGVGDPAGTRYCAPRRCSADPQCGLGGRCDLASGGFCVGK